MTLLQLSILEENISQVREVIKAALNTLKQIFGPNINSAASFRLIHLSDKLPKH